MIAELRFEVPFDDGAEIAQPCQRPTGSASSDPKIEELPGGYAGSNGGALLACAANRLTPAVRLHGSREQCA